MLILLLLLNMCACSPKDQAKEALDAARDLAAKGEYDQALEKHIWFHDHALGVDQSYYGVRLSFALSDWVKLGENYPKALSRLKAIRDEKASRLLAGEENRDLFHDVESINDHLGEMKATVELFKTIDASQPDFAASVYELAVESLVVFQELELARKY